MKKVLLALTLAALLGACTSTSATKEDTNIVEVQPGVKAEKVAILLPINNTNDQNTADLFWLDLSKGTALKSKKIISSDEVKKVLNASGYSYGDQLTQVDTVEEKLDLQAKIGADGLVYFTVEEVISSLNKNPLKPSTVRSVNGKAILYVNGKEARIFNITGEETKKISAEVLRLTLEIGGRFATDQDFEATILSILAISAPEVRSEVSEAILAMSGPAGTKLQTLMFEKGLLKESPYKKAINNAVESITKTL